MKILLVGSNYIIYMAVKFESDVSFLIWHNAHFNAQEIQLATFPSNYNCNFNLWSNYHKDDSAKYKQNQKYPKIVSSVYNKIM